MNANHLKDKIREISAYTFTKEVEDMRVVVSLSMLEADKKNILHKALDVQEKFLQSKYEHKSNVEQSELRIGEI